MRTFRFKQFYINHSKSAHKVGTDGVLIGAWTSLKHVPATILDIGTGSGVIALMLAQRSFADTIDAIEIDDNAHEECVNNFENSIWNDRLFCYHGDLKDLAEEPELKYDLIVCNPPFFENDQQTLGSIREMARKQISLTYVELLASVQKLLSSNGQFSVVIPYQDFDKFVGLAEDFKLFPCRITQVKGNASAGFKRSLIQSSYDKKPTEIDELILEKSRHNYTEDYINLVEDFYLKM